MQRWRQNWKYATTNQELPKNTGSHHQLGERYEMDFPSEPTEGTNPDDNLILDFWPPTL